MKRKDTGKKQNISSSDVICDLKSAEKMHPSLSNSGGKAPKKNISKEIRKTNRKCLKGRWLRSKNLEKTLSKKAVFLCIPIADAIEKRHFIPTCYAINGDIILAKNAASIAIFVFTATFSPLTPWLRVCLTDWRLVSMFHKVIPAKKLHNCSGREKHRKKWIKNGAFTA